MEAHRHTHETTIPRTGWAETLQTQPFLKRKVTNESWRRKEMKKYKGAFLSWNGLFFPIELNLSVCAALKPFDSDTDLSKRTSGLNSSVWGKSSKGELVNYTQKKTHKYILPQYYGLWLPNLHLVGLLYSTPVIFCALVIQGGWNSPIIWLIILSEYFYRH